MVIDLTLVGDQPGQGSEEGRLTNPVGSGQQGNLVADNRQVGSGDQLPLAPGNADVVKTNDCRSRW